MSLIKFGNVYDWAIIRVSKPEGFLEVGIVDIDVINSIRAN